MRERKRDGAREKKVAIIKVESSGNKKKNHQQTYSSFNCESKKALAAPTSD